MLNLTTFVMWVLTFSGCVYMLVILHRPVSYCEDSVYCREVYLESFVRHLTLLSMVAVGLEGVSWVIMFFQYDMWFNLTALLMEKL